MKDAPGQPTTIAACVEILKLIIKQAHFS